VYLQHKGSPFKACVEHHMLLSQYDGMPERQMLLQCVQRASFLA
jgi:hypothetical protein